jgi:predicted amidophosphoribosyltransferase
VCDGAAAYASVQKVQGLLMAASLASLAKRCSSCSYLSVSQGLACPCCGRAYRHSAQRDMMQCTLCRKHVHTACDPEACEEKVLVII